MNWTELIWRPICSTRRAVLCWYAMLQRSSVQRAAAAAAKSDHRPIVEAPWVVRDATNWTPTWRTNEQYYEDWARGSWGAETAQCISRKSLTAVLCSGGFRNTVAAGWNAPRAPVRIRLHAHDIAIQSVQCISRLLWHCRHGHESVFCNRTKRSIEYQDLHIYTYTHKRRNECFTYMIIYLLLHIISRFSTTFIIRSKSRCMF